MSRDSIVFLQTQLGFCNQFEKFYSISSSANRISRLGERFSWKKTISSSKKGSRDCSDVWKCNERQFDFNEFHKVTGEINFDNSSNFTSQTLDSFPTTAVNKNTGPDKNMTCKSVITLDQQAKKELSWLSWWITNMKIDNEKSLFIVPQT